MDKPCHLTKDMVLDMLNGADSWDVGESCEFSYRYPYSERYWIFRVSRCEDMYAPFIFALEGRKMDKDGKPTLESWGRRYNSIARLLLHIGNGLNENVNVLNRYNTVYEWLNDGYLWS